MTAKDYAVTFPTAKSKGLILDEEGEKKILKHGGWVEIANVGYAYLVTGRRETRNRTLLHRFLLNAPKGVKVDHVNRNRLDNRISNLRLVSDTENSINTSIRSHNKSGYLGVFWNKQKSKWQAKTSSIHLGFFNDVEDAAMCYESASLQIYKEFSPYA